MHLTFVDDSIAFDGYSPSSQPLGGPEKAFASLPADRAAALEKDLMELLERHNGGGSRSLAAAFSASWGSRRSSACSASRTSASASPPI